jgi:hypothetical protein
LRKKTTLADDGDDAVGCAVTSGGEAMTSQKTRTTRLATMLSAEVRKKPLGFGGMVQVRRGKCNLGFGGGGYGKLVRDGEGGVQRKVGGSGGSA